MDWDHYRYFLELSRTGRISAAALRLGVNPTTVSRRVQMLEGELGARLFTRAAGLHQLTEAGRELLPRAEQMESMSLSIEASVLGDRTTLSGTVRIGATEGFGARMLAPRLTALTSRHPHLRIDLLAVPRIVNLSRREADIVVSLEPPTQGAFQVARLTDYRLGLYASRSYLAANGPVSSREALRGQAFVSYIDDLLYSQELRYLSDFCRSDQIVLRSTSLLAQCEAVRAGAGLAILPHFLANDHADLVAVLPDDIQLTRTFWMVMPDELRHTARMMATWDFLLAMDYER